MSKLRIRFVVNQRTGQSGFVQSGTKGVENFSRALVREVAFHYSEVYFELLKNQVERRLKTDIQRELEFTAKLFMQHVVGIAGRNRGPTGTLTTVAPKSEGFTERTTIGVRSLVPEWPRRSPDYLARRKSDEWFHRKGEVLGKLASTKTWTGAFGGISVSLVKHTSMGAAQAKKSTPKLGGLYHGDERVGVGTIRVQAMGRITPEMLPALAGGALNDYGQNPRRSGLLSKLGDPIAWRLGGNPARVPFRPTIQPFLAFFLTRQMPNAVMRRLEQGFEQGRWLRTDIGGAGRTR